MAGLRQVAGPESVRGVHVGYILDGNAKVAFTG